MKVLVTGSFGLVGSEAVRFYLERGADVIGVENNMRRYFFGEGGSVENNVIEHPRYKHYEIDIRHAALLFEFYKPDAVIHCAAQPSHDWAAKEPLTDFGVNANGTLTLLEACRKYSPESVFIYVSTNKVYGDKPNKMSFYEHETRYEPHVSVYWDGVNEHMSIDQNLHSLFGVSKLAGDLLAQEYGRYFGLKTGIFRLGCITGPQHAGVELHGFLSYMVKCKKENRRYKVYGYKGKQVRDNIHALDLVRAFDCFISNPRTGEVYNMGGSRHSNVSVLEALEKLNLDYEYIDEPRKGDHIWYISDVSKFKSHYPEWEYKYDIDKIFEELMDED